VVLLQRRAAGALETPSSVPVRVAGARRLEPDAEA
jgi:hypothetical protein